MKRLGNLVTPIGFALFFLAGALGEAARKGYFGFEYGGLISVGTYMVMAVLAAVKIGNVLARRKVNRLYSIGDPRPVHKFLAFVEYGEQGERIWTSL